MIAVSIEPSEIHAGKPADLVFCLSNTSRGTCTNVRLVFSLPHGVLLVRGRQRVQIARLRGGQRHQHVIRVQAQREGTFHLVSTNFSYRDPAGRSRRVLRVALPLRVVAPPPLRLPVLALVLEDGCFSAGTWGQICVRIANVGEAIAHNLTLSVTGPGLQVRTEPFGSLIPGKAVLARIPACAREAGSVPVDLEAVFQDSDGQWYGCRQREYLAIEAAPPRVIESRIQVQGDYLSEGSQKGDRLEIRRGIAKLPSWLCPCCGVAAPPGKEIRYCTNCGAKV